ncbi:hypothetical protein ACLOAU_18715 [Niabella sp. CJ426]|uniref:hypothetical protein n=1 Tax=Niabella sp. CJ426 TaxID=3393740 RepID=UPI003D08C810
MHKILSVLLAACFWQASFAQTCATSERVQNINFAQGTTGAVNVTGSNINGWLGSGAGTVLSGGSTYFSDNANAQTFSQSVTKVNLKGNGAIFTLVFTAFNGSNNNIEDGDRANFFISYGGTVYATLATTDGSGLIGTITFSNGATGSLNGGATGSTPLNFVVSDPTAVGKTLVLHLPVTIPNSGNLQMQFQPLSAGPSLATDDYTIFTASLKACPIIYSGTVLDDGNGLKDGAVNGTGTNVGGLQVALYDGSGNIIPGTTTNVNADGTYTIAYAGSGTFSVGIVNLPTSYVYIGEKRNTDLISDGIVDGKAGQITITNSSTNTDHPNNLLGINARPETYAVTSTVTGVPTSVNFGTLNPLQGSDVEQQSTQGNWSGTGESIQITTLPTNSFQLVYNSIVVTTGQVISNYDPSLMVIRPTAGTPTGTSTTSFGYATVDANGTPDLTPATYTINFSQSLPVLFKDLTATISNGRLNVQWSTLSEKNNSLFVIEASADGAHFTKIGEMGSRAVNGNSDSRLEYEWTLPVSGISLGMGIGLLLLGGSVAGFRRRLQIWIVVVLAGCALVVSGCQKSKDLMADVNGKHLFIRIAQVDHDGTSKYSESVKVIQK